MAKIVAPLFSGEVSGKFLEGIVFFKSRGQNCCRTLVKPTQPNSVLQGYVRVIQKIIGKGISKVQCIAKGSAVDSALYTLVGAAKPDLMNWNAWLGGAFQTLFVAAGAISTVAFTSMIGVYSALEGTDLTAWKTNASALNMADFAFGYGYTDNVEAGFQMYAVAKGAYGRALEDTGKYATNPKDWVVTDIDGFADDFATA